MILATEKRINKGDNNEGPIGVKKIYSTPKSPILYFMDYTSMASKMFHRFTSLNCN